MKITSKRGRKPPVEVRELNPSFESFGIIIVDTPGMTPEEARRAEEAIRELRKQLEELGRIIDSGWYNLRTSST